MLGETRLIMSAAREVTLIGEGGLSVSDKAQNQQNTPPLSAAVRITVCHLRFDGAYLTNGEL